MATAALAGSAQTLDIDKGNVLRAPVQPAPQAMASSRAADGYTLRFCGDIYQWLGLNASATYVQYITIPADVATQLAGNTVTSVTFSICLGGQDASKTAGGTIFVTEDPQVAKLSEMTLAAQAPTKIRDSYLVEPGYQTASFATGEEYVIKENTPFSFGVMYECEPSQYPVGIDDKQAGMFAGTIKLFQNDNCTDTYPMAEAVGANLMMYAVTQGEKTQLLDLCTVIGASLDGFTLPIYKDAVDVNAHLAINNLGDNVLSSINYSYKVNDGEYTDGEASLSIASRKVAWASLPLGALPAGHNTVTIKVNKINGKNIDTHEQSVSYVNIAQHQAYDRSFVVEEFTGTWCGWCPRGIVGMDYMQETHPDRFIGIAVHASSGNAVDKFQVSNYLPFIKAYAYSFPSSIVNRDPLFALDPTKANLESGYVDWLSQVSHANIGLEYEVVGDSLELKATTNFSIDDDHAYNLAFVLTEDSLVSTQTNYYAGGQYGKLDGWESKASKVKWSYTHTAIRIDAAFGNDLASSVEAGKDYVATGKFLYIGPMKRKQFKLNNTHAIALLFDAETGVIVNAAKVDLAEDADGIDDAIAAPDAPVEYYNIQGQKVANPRSGQLYIRVQGDKATKVVY